MSRTQEYISIEQIVDDIIFLKDGGAALILQISAVNFGLLAQEEQVAIIQSFAQMLNSLSFAIQITIRSKRLDISLYLKLLDQATKLQTNPLLAGMMERYSQFVQSLIKEREVLDKHFFIIIPVSSLELGIHLPSFDKLKKVKTILLPRRDQVIRQLNRVGLKANQLTSLELIKLFYEIYNWQNNQQDEKLPLEPPVNLKTTTLPKPPPQRLTQTIPPQPPPSPPVEPRVSRTHPFVVEELIDSI